MTALPTGLSIRPLGGTDAAAVAAVMAAEELAATGEIAIEEADILSDWQRPGFDIADSTIGVFAQEGLVGYAEHSHGDRGDAAVHPEWHGQGIGTWLAGWLTEKVRERGGRVIGMPNPEGSPGDRLLAALGWEPRWTSWVLALPQGRDLADRDLPPGYAVRAARTDEQQAAHDVLEDAFLEWSDRARETFEEFRATVLERPGREPWQLRVVVDAEETVVGVTVLIRSEIDGIAEGYVDRLAVRRDQRGRGLAQVLLNDAFAICREHGAARTTLSTDSRTGALDLYRKVGMVVTQSWVNRAARW
ncbi:GNAT family N-acetyltransferase [Nocardioides daejeonensis]|uniref:GNAT family N-acetyltransferase n=1 Tax=Nocardioides daejeonensis TaxID=1046556 RepID=UPI000D74AFB2|nr:GNAT family N-acetyltransferase [Nocardioides daejeonensis]